MGKSVWTLLGASKGLGRAFFEAALDRDPNLSFHLVARSQELLDELRQKAPGRVQTLKVDLSDPPERAKLWSQIESPQRMFYFAGGGPYGPFATKDIKDHRWALETTFMGAMEVIHWGVRRSMQQIVVVGSAVAEDKADPGAASYSAAKHALHGLLKTLWDEPLGGVDLRLFSPGYMDTSLLPPGATVRQQSLLSPQEAAAKLLDWCLDPEGPRHYKLST